LNEIIIAKTNIKYARFIFISIFFKENSDMLKKDKINISNLLMIGKSNNRHIKIKNKIFCLLLFSFKKLIFDKFFIKRFKS
jgi:hypothetical protein